MWLIELLALIIFIYWLAVLLEYRRYARAIPKLSASAEPDLTAADGKTLPLVSVILAAKEEEASIIETVKHLQSQTYPRLEIIAVNDRSSDQTGAKLDALKQWAERSDDFPVPITVVHITRLPAGWIGKNHALYQGFQQARGQLLLFTDADVRFQPQAIASAVRYMRREQADHITAVPAMPANGFWLRAFVHYFLFALSMFVKPWRAGDDRSRKHSIGIGAFNLVTRKAYEAAGTHRAIALRPDDDLQLGARIKRTGFRQRLVSAASMLEVEWYPNLPSAVHGLEKNFFSGFRYRWWLAAGAWFGQLLFYLYPFAGIWFSGGWASAALGASVIIFMALYASAVRSLTSGPVGPRELVLLPFSVMLLCYVLIRSVALTFKRGGIYWRGTFYPLHELKKKMD